MGWSSKFKLGLTLMLSLTGILVVLPERPEAEVRPLRETGVVAGARADSIINLRQWQAGNGGNGHWYGILAALHSWHGADSISRTFTIDTIRGHLAAIADSFENRFIFDSIVPGSAPADVPELFLLGGLKCTGEWGWITSESFLYTHWRIGEPNYAHETVVAMWGPGAFPPIDPDGYWNNVDPAIGYWAVVEWGEFDLPNPIATCGNGVLECPEECDDGNANSGDGCTPLCFECPILLTGDVNGDGRINSADIIYLLNYVFIRGPSPVNCPGTGDVNCNSVVNTSDIIYLVNYIFKSGLPPCDACEKWGRC